jgi:Rps23 Pro-64 3,4-dihydroxylase Tpa1-like proline 4-hydroxylase
MNSYLSPSFKNLVSVATKFQAEYQNNVPFPNIHFNDFFNAKFLDSVLAEFNINEERDSVFFNDANQLKWSSKGDTSFGQNTKELIHFLNTESFLQFLQKLTGIEETLLPDPYLIGGGLHEIKRDGFLKIHADFNKHTKTKLDRRINVLIYLNKDWEDEYGGHFELWNKDMTHCEKKIKPDFNTLAIFSTSDYSYHGHPSPLNCPVNSSRKSIALYYYTNGRPLNEVHTGLQDHGTLFKVRKNNQMDTQVIETKTNYRAILKDFIPPIILRWWKNK